MPNWIEGTLKLRGKREDIRRFLKNEITASTWYGETPDVSEQVIDDSGDDYLDFGFELEGTVVRVPKRKHKKRRIAKKWAKKYGYYEIKIHAHVDDVETMSTKETFDYYLSDIYYTLEG